MRKGWAETTIGTQLTLEYGKPLTEPNRDGVGYPVFGSAGVVGLHSKPLVTEGQVIVVGRKGTAGAVYWSQSPCFVIDTAYFVQIKTDIDSKFLFLLLTQIDLKSVTAQTGVPGLNRERAYNLKCKIPPLHEQKRIVDLIASVDSYIEALQRQLESAKRSRNAILHALLTAGGEGWAETSLKEIAEVIMGQSPDGKSYNESGEGLPFMQGSAEFGQRYPTPEKWCSDPKRIAEPGDLLLSVRAPVGDTNYANQRIAIGRGLSVIRANSKSLTDFIRFAIQLNVTEMIASSGSGMFASITGKNLREFRVLLPPLPAQKRIVEIINTIDDVISKAELIISEAQNLRSGLLSDLLSGEHEIPVSYDKAMGAA